MSLAWYGASAAAERLPEDASGSSSLPVTVPVLSLHSTQGVSPKFTGLGHGRENATPNTNSSRQEFAAYLLNFPGCSSE